jgi:hypothetical protein
LHNKQNNKKNGNHKKWSERQDIDNSWDVRREELMAAFIMHEAPNFSQRFHQCQKAVLSCIRCLTCK